MDQELQNMNATEYKKFHEAFMENNHGSNAFHTFLCIFFTVQCTLFCSLSRRQSEMAQYLYEYVLIVLTLVFAHTILASYIYFLNGMIFTMLIMKFTYDFPKVQIHKAFTSKNHYRTGKVQSITCIRGLTYLITVFAILAVDFQSFPRYLAKTEDYGYSLMDTGVGLFVIMSGLVHKDLRHEQLATIIKGNIKFITILMCLGVGRFVSIKHLEYQEHVTEYGVHWNFFFTLAVCKFLSTILLYYCSNTLLTSIIILFSHECLLFYELEQWVFGKTPRTNFINANKEGLASSLGYVSLYVFAAYIKTVLCNNKVSRYNIQLKLVIQSIILWLLAHIVHFYRPTSRTLANASYCLYLQAVLVTTLSVLYFFEVQYQNKELKFEVPLIIRAINSNGLIYFLISNLITGAINILMRTLFIPMFETFLILNIYMIITISLVLYLLKKGVTV